jgi:hypothetical protein
VIIPIREIKESYAKNCRYIFFKKYILFDQNVLTFKVKSPYDFQGIIYVVLDSKVYIQNGNKKRSNCPSFYWVFSMSYYLI